MRNKEVSQKFYELASLAELAGENPFKVNAYVKAARAIEYLPTPIEDLARENRLTEIKGIGSGIAKKIVQYLETGKIEKLEEFKKKVPPSLLEMEKISGIGPKGAYALYKHLGITTVEELKEAALNGKIRSLPGFGAKKEENILKAIQGLRKKKVEKRVSIGIGLPLAEAIVEFLKKNSPIEKIQVCGSIRRMKEKIGDIDILATSEKPEEVMARFIEVPMIKDIVVKGETKTSILTNEGLQVDLRVVEPSSFGAAIQYFTGSKQHNIKLRELAIKSGYKINEYGVFEVKTERKIGGEKEEDVYNALGLPWIPPEMREDRGEVEAAMTNDLPNLVELFDIKGDIHMHTTYSDGANTLEEMVKRAMELGYEYIVVSDHAKALGVASGLTLDEYKRQKREIDELNEKFGDKIRIFFGAELNILSDGRVDFPEEELEIFDICLAGIHTALTQPMKKIMERLKKAMRIKKIKIIAHPTGRVIGEREGYEVDLEELLEEAKNTGTILEINANPKRLDLNDMNAMHAKKTYGLKFVIGTDAHSREGLDDMKYGIGVARRAWLTRADIINTLPLKEFEKFIREE